MGLERSETAAEGNCDSFLVSGKLRIRSWTLHSSWPQLASAAASVVVAQLPGAPRIESEAWLTAMATWGMQQAACSRQQAAGQEANNFLGKAGKA